MVLIRVSYKFDNPRVSVSCTCKFIGNTDALLFWVLFPAKMVAETRGESCKVQLLASPRDLLFILCPSRCWIGLDFLAARCANNDG
jgi:hypothetical protein